ncbi:MAG: MarR family transcriptional regulator [Chloroflexi bacterium]|nr:MAG: MarR family transcriptional regulator [Chloroflexota bacterium]MBL1197447.1 MarR family transcriptional regulator [Chloroflexota bacterium]
MCFMTSQTEFLKTVEDWSKFYFFQSLTEFFNYLKHSELSLLQAYALTYLYFKGPIKISDLCEHMVVSPGAASQMVDRLEKLEMVARVADPEDRRVRKVRVLEKGERFMQENFIYSQSWLSEVPGNLTPEQEDQITAGLAILMQSFGKNDQSDLQK